MWPFKKKVESSPVDFDPNRDIDTLLLSSLCGELFDYHYINHEIPLSFKRLGVPDDRCERIMAAMTSVEEVINAWQIYGRGYVRHEPFNANLSVYQNYVRMLRGES